MLIFFVSFCIYIVICSSFFFFFNDTATTEIYTLSLHDALPILPGHYAPARRRASNLGGLAGRPSDRKSTRLNSSHRCISYAVFCLKKKKTEERVSRNTETEKVRRLLLEKKKKIGVRAKTEPRNHSLFPFLFFPRPGLFFPFPPPPPPLFPFSFFFSPPL